MENNIIAYVGIDNSDNILYLSRILSKLDKKILIVDHSDTKAITYSIPQLDGIDMKLDTVTYRKVDFTQMDLSERIVKKYDIVLIDYGFSPRRKELGYCNRIVYVTDLYLHNTNKLYCMEDYDISIKSLLIRNLLGIKISPESVAIQIEKNIPVENITLLSFNENDLVNSIINQYNQSFRFTNISRQLKSYLIREISSLYPEILKKDIVKAYQKARKGM